MIKLPSGIFVPEHVAAEYEREQGVETLKQFNRRGLKVIAVIAAFIVVIYLGGHHG